MKQRFRLYRRKQGGRYYIHNELTGKQESLHTNDRAKATRLLHAKNEAGELPARLQLVCQKVARNLGNFISGQARTAR
jgi:hypothetical protein